MEPVSQRVFRGRLRYSHATLLDKEEIYKDINYRQSVPIHMVGDCICGNQEDTVKGER